MSSETKATAHSCLSNDAQDGEPRNGDPAQRRLPGPAAQALAFLKLLFGAFVSGFVTLFTVPNRESASFPIAKLEDVAALAIHYSRVSEQNVYVHLGTLGEAKAGYVRGKIADIVAIPGVWIEIDIKGGVHAAQNLPPKLEDALALLDAFPLKPTIVVFSGGGIHVYVLFTAPFVIDSDEQRREAQRLVEGYQAVIRQAAQARGWTVDSTADLARILRVPGTKNRKRDPAVPVQILEVHPERRYDIDEIRKHLPPDTGNDQRHRPSRGAGPTSGDVPAAALIRAECTWLNHCYDDASSLPEPEWYAGLSIVGRCRDAEVEAHTMSAPYPEYDQRETDEKLAHALDDAGPRTCDYIRQHFDNGSYCAKCPHSGRITSPIELGRQACPSVQLRVATETITDAMPKIKSDPGAAFVPEVLGSLVVIKRWDDAAWVRTKAQLAAYKVPLRTLTPAMAKSAWKTGGSEARDVSALNVGGDLQDEANSPGGAGLVDDSIDNAPVKGLRVPHGYVINRAGVCLVVPGPDGPIKEPIAHAPILITGRLEDVEDHSTKLQVAWLRRGNWKDVIVERGVPLDARRQTALLDLDFPGTSNQSKRLVSFLGKFEEQNLSTIPSRSIASRCGWLSFSGSELFACGREIVTSGTSSDANGLVVHGREPGDDQILAAFQGTGTLEGWLDIVSHLADHPVAQIPLYLSFVAPTLRILRAPNFGVDLAGRTTTGKTTVARVAASVWGVPDERQPNSAIRTWDTTVNYAERLCGLLCDLPLILDDSQRVRDPDKLAQALYLIFHGQGRGRATRAGMGITRHWRTVLLSTGERALVSFTAHGGVRMRLLTVKRLPFGRPSTATTAAVAALNIGVQAHHGVAGPAFVRWLLGQREHWDQYHRDYLAIQAAITVHHASAESGRLASLIAAIEMAAGLAHAALDLPWDFNDQLDDVWHEILVDGREAAPGVRALRDVLDWAHSQVARFHGRAAEERPPAGGYLGRWDSGQDWQFIAFFPQVLSKFLTESGYAPDAVIGEWADRGWLVADRGRHKHQIRTGDGKHWMVVVPRAATEEVGQ